MASIQIDPERDAATIVGAPMRHLDELSQEEVRRLLKFIQRRVKNVEDAEDILQATFLQALLCEQKFSHASLYRTWLFGIATNLIKNHFRRFYRLPVYELFSDEYTGCASESEEVDVLVNNSRLLERTMVAINDLPDNMQSVLLLTMESGGLYREAASTLGVPIGTVRSRLSRARDRLRNDLAIDTEIAPMGF